MKPTYFFLLLFSIVFSSCATRYTPTFSGDPNAYKIYELDGKKVFGQHKNNVTCEVAVLSSMAPNFVYEVYFENFDTNNITISPTQVKLTTHTLKGKTKSTAAINVDPIIADITSKINKENNNHESVRKSIRSDKFFNTVGDLLSIGRKKSDEEKEARQEEIKEREADWEHEVQRHNTALNSLTNELNKWSNGTLKTTTLAYNNSVTGKVLIPHSNNIQRSTLKINVGEGFEFDFNMNPHK